MPLSYMQEGGLRLKLFFYAYVFVKILIYDTLLPQLASLIACIFSIKHVYFVMFTTLVERPAITDALIKPF